MPLRGGEFERSASALPSQVCRNGGEALARALFVGDDGERRRPINIDVMRIGRGDDVLRPGSFEELCHPVDIQHVQVGERLIDEHKAAF